MFPHFGTDKNMCPKSKHFYYFNKVIYANSTCQKALNTLCGYMGSVQLLTFQNCYWKRGRVQSTQSETSVIPY